MRLFLQLVSLEFLTAMVLAAATRAAALGSYLWVGVTEFAFISIWFTMQKLMIENTLSRTWLGFVAYQLGGVAGAVVGIWLSRRFEGKGEKPM